MVGPGGKISAAVDTYIPNFAHVAHVTNLTLQRTPFSCAKRNCGHIRPALQRFCFSGLAVNVSVRVTNRNQSRRRALVFGGKWLRRQGQREGDVESALQKIDIELYFTFCW